MEFWGVEVKAGQPLKVVPDNDQIIHLSQASLGESKKSKGDEAVPLHVKFGDQKLVLGTLSSSKIPQISFDLVFEKEFELSHNWNGGSVYFIGYKSLTGGEDDFSDFDSESDEDIPMTIEENGKVGPAVPAKPASLKANAVKKSSEKAKANIAEAAKPQGKESGGDSDEDDDDSDDDLDASDDEGTDSEDDSDDEDDSDEDDEETPKKAQVGGKKRPNESASKTPDAKKAKLVTPQKTDGKKGGHTATPHPAKQAGKTPASNKSPKSGGSISCKSCSKAFNSENALQAHTKAKHEGK